MKIEDLVIGMRYITDHNTPIVITRIAYGGIVYAGWPSGRECCVRNPEKSILKLFTLNVGDRIAFDRNDSFHTVSQVGNDNNFFVASGSRSYSVSNIAKIIKRRVKENDIVRIGDYEYLVEYIANSINEYVMVDSKRRKNSSDPFRKLSTGEANYFSVNSIDFILPDEPRYDPYILTISDDCANLSKTTTEEQTMKIEDMDKENLQAGKEDALAQKKAYEREQAHKMYSALLTQLDQINAQMKNLENEKNRVEAEMKKFE